MTDNKNCLSCNRQIVNNKGSTSFQCPKCGRYEVVRCAHCRKIASKYKCPQCGFEGPIN